MADPICGAARTITTGNASAVLVCDREPGRHAGLDHRDFRHQVSWPICETYCPTARTHGDPPQRHVCGRYRGDTIARYDGA